jgi:glycosyltransferase involved in cell wall biosynthesis
MRSHALIPAAVVALYRHIKRVRPDVVQAWLYRSNAVAGLAARAAGVPVVWGIHCSSLDPLGLFARLIVRVSGKISAHLADFVVNCSTESAAVHAKLGFDSAPGRVIHNGYDPDSFRPDDSARVAMRASFGIEDEAFVIGCVSRWNSFKDIPNLLRAVAIVHANELPIRCFLVGRGLTNSNPDLAAEIIGSKCQDTIFPLGERTDLPILAQAFDIHALSSASEAFPNTVAETMLCGLPNVVTDVGDCAMIVGDSGWVVPPGDSGKFAAAIVAAWQEWKDNPTCWRNRQVQARQLIEGRFAFDRMANAYEQVWKEVS